MLADSHVYFHRAADVLGLPDKVRDDPADTPSQCEGGDRYRRGGRRAPGLQRLSGAAQHGPRPDEGRTPLPPGDGRGSRRGAGQPHDLEDRGGGCSVWRRQGRYRLRSPLDVRAGPVRGHHALCGADEGGHRTDDRHPGTRCQHQRQGHGLDHARVLQVRRLLTRCGDRQTAGALWLRGSRCRHRSRGHGCPGRSA